MRYWVKFLALMALMTLGLTTAASAHGGVDGDVSARPVMAGQVHADTDAEILGTSAQYFEASEVPVDRPCTGACCCLGISHCSPCGPSASALQGVGAGINYDPAGKRINVAYNSLAKTLDRKFGLERPPRV